MPTRSVVFEGRVLPHQYHVDVGDEVDFAVFAHGEMIARDTVDEVVIDRMQSKREVQDLLEELGLRQRVAGMALRFSLTVADVREASDEEIAHGHVHGEHGHHH